MDAGSRCGKGFQIRERSGNTQTFFLCAATPEFLCWGGLVYSDAPERPNDGGGAGPPGARTGRESCAVRNDHSAGTARSLDIAAAGGGNFSWDLGCVGAAARSHRTVWRDVVCGVAEYPRVGAAHGAWCGRIQSIAAGNVAWPGIDRWQRVSCPPGVPRGSIQSARCGIDYLQPTTWAQAQDTPGDDRCDRKPQAAAGLATQPAPRRYFLSSRPDVQNPVFHFTQRRLGITSV